MHLLRSDKDSIRLHWGAVNAENGDESIHVGTRRG